MTENILQFWPEIFTVVFSSIVLFAFAITLGMQHRSKVLPGSKGHRKKDDEGEDEEISADGYIDSFAGEIEEAGGGMPPVVKLALFGILIWWFLYLVIYWAPK